MKKLLYLICLLPSLSFAVNYQNGKLPMWDHSTDATITIDFPHHEIHEGDHFFVVGSTSLANGQICEFIVITPDSTNWSHMTFQYNSSAAGFTFVGYEAVTVATTGASAVPPLNNDRNSSNASTLLVFRSTGTATTSSTIVDGPHTVGASGNPVSSVGGGSAREDEIILKQNTKYVFRFTNLTTANIINFRANWYEHANR